MDSRIFHYYLLLPKNSLPFSYSLHAIMQATGIGGRGVLSTNNEKTRVF